MAGFLCHGVCHNLLTPVDVRGSLTVSPGHTQKALLKPGLPSASITGKLMTIQKSDIGAARPEVSSLESPGR
jgi:hypothetical protein